MEHVVFHLWFSSVPFMRTHRFILSNKDITMSSLSPSKFYWRSNKVPQPRQNPKQKWSAPILFLVVEKKSAPDSAFQAIYFNFCNILGQMQAQFHGCLQSHTPMLHPYMEPSIQRNQNRENASHMNWSKFSLIVVENLTNPIQMRFCGKLADPWSAREASPCIGLGSLSENFHSLDMAYPAALWLAQSHQPTSKQISSSEKRNSPSCSATVIECFEFGHYKMLFQGEKLKGCKYNTMVSLRIIG